MAAGGSNQGYGRDPSATADGSDNAIAFDAVIAYNDSMAQLTVRNIPETLVRALRVRAANHGRSAEAEHRLILAEVLKPNKPDFWAEADRLRKETPRQRTNSTDLLDRKSVV